MPGTLMQRDAFCRSDDSCQCIQHMQALSLYSSCHAQICYILLPCQHYKALHASHLCMCPHGKLTCMASILLCMACGWSPARHTFCTHDANAGEV